MWFDATPGGWSGGGGGVRHLYACVVCAVGSHRVSTAPPAPTRPAYFPCACVRGCGAARRAAAAGRHLDRGSARCVSMSLECHTGGA
eukprot:1577089-Prymnesium_polylepis.1